MLWASLDLDILEDPAFVELEDEVPGSFWCWVRVLQQAKRVNQQGLVLRADGRPLTAKDLHRIHRATSLDAWQGILDKCVELELLDLNDGIYCVTDWRRWHKTPSDMPDRVADRVARHRAAKRAETPDVEPCNDGVTGRNAQKRSNDTQHSTAQHSRAKHNTAKQSKSSSSRSVTPDPTPAAPGDSPAQVLERLRQFNANGQARSP